MGNTSILSDANNKVSYPAPKVGRINKVLFIKSSVCTGLFLFCLNDNSIFFYT